MTEPATSEDIQRLGNMVEALTHSVSDAVTQQTAAMQELVRVLGDERRIDSARATGGGAQITLNAPGSWALIVAIACAVVSTYSAADAKGEAAELRAVARDLGRKVERREDYLNMLWQRYPELRPSQIQPEKPTP